MNVSPARFSDKTDKESKLYFIDWRNGLANGETFAAVAWSSDPNGLAFSAPTEIGQTTQVMIGGGVPGQTYRVRCRVTLTDTGEVLEASVNDAPGIPLQVLGPPVEYRPTYRVGP